MRLSSAAVLLVQTMLLGTSAYAQQLDAASPSEKPVAGFRSVDIGDEVFAHMCAGRARPTVIVEPGGDTSLETVFSWNLPVG
jgi:hypothetical protein